MKPYQKASASAVDLKNQCEITDDLWSLMRGCVEQEMTCRMSYVRPCGTRNDLE